MLENFWPILTAITFGKLLIYFGYRIFALKISEKISKHRTNVVTSTNTMLTPT